MKLRMIVFVLLASPGLTSCEKADPQTFDLDCRGIYHGGYKDPTVDHPWHQSFAVDLRQMTFCRDKCAETEKLASVTDTTITLEKPTDQEDITTTIERYNGKFHMVWNMDLSYPTTLETNATCERTPFTGVPPRKF